jgi:hypothetical protein
MRLRLDGTADNSGWGAAASGAATRRKWPMVVADRQARPMGWESAWCASDWARPESILISNISLLGALCKMAKLSFLISKNYQNFWGGRINKKEQLFFWAQIEIPNGFWITNSRKKQDLNFVWIFKGINNFGKIPIIHQNYLLYELQEYKFRRHHLH